MTIKTDRTKMTYQQVISEVNRCLLCEDAPCNIGCATDTKPSEFIKSFKFMNVLGAVNKLRKNNILAGCCSYVCPTCRLCERGCTRSGLDEPVKIAEIQKYLVEYEIENNIEVYQTPEYKGGKKVAIIGSGPAGLSCAASLALKGFNVTIFEKASKPGGLLRYGIPSHRLPKKILDWEIDIVKKLGVDIKLNKQIKGDKGLEDLFTNGFGAVYLATGLDEAYDTGVKGSQSEKVISWRKFLEKANTGKLPAIKGKNVAIIGGGSVAMDCAIVSVLGKANRVYAISLESMSELPADEKEKKEAFEAGITFKPSSRILSINEAGAKLKLKGEEIKWKIPDNFIPSNAVSVPGTEFALTVDYVIQAIGAGVSNEQNKLFGNLARNGNLIKITKTGKTSDKRVFAGGDITVPGNTVVGSVNDGKKSAEAIAASLKIPMTYAPRTEELPSLKTEFLGLSFLNPFMLSSSPVGNTAEMVARCFDEGWGGVVYKTLNDEKHYTVHDPSPRLNIYNYNDMRFVGLQNVEQVSERPLGANLKDIRWLRDNYPDRVVIVSIMGFDDDQWAELAKVAEDSGAQALEMNFSCPQMATEKGGHKVGQSYDLIEKYTNSVKDAVGIPIIAKMTPNIADMVPVAMASKRGGADSISAINTILGISDIDLDKMVPMPTIAGKSSKSGFSGPSCRPFALRFVSDLYNDPELKLPISGIGGVENWIDAACHILMGASTIQVTTGIMKYGYRIIKDMCEGLQYYMKQKGVKSLNELVGVAAKKLTTPAELNTDIQVVTQVDTNKCIGCGICHIVCHDGANQAMEFDFKTRKAAVTEDRCVGCLLCKHVCPVWDCISYKETTNIVIGGQHYIALDFVEK
jgi:dihydropyrimidine dehydrogenase (NAD+) subunit PreA